MRTIAALVSFAVVTLALPGYAEAKGGGWFEGAKNAGRIRGALKRSESAAAPILRGPSRAPVPERVFRAPTQASPARRSVPAPRARPDDAVRAPRRVEPTRAAPIRGPERPAEIRDEQPGRGLFGGTGRTDRGRDALRIREGGEGGRRRAAPEAATTSGGARGGLAAPVRGNPDFHTFTPGQTFGHGSSGGNGGGNHGGGGGGSGSGWHGGGGNWTGGGHWPRTPAPAPNYRVGWGDGWRNGYRIGYRDGRSDSFRAHCYDPWYDRHHWYLSFSFGAGCGPYYGVSYYRPFHSWTAGVDYAFFYPEPVTYCYVPFGFYAPAAPVYVTRHTTVIRETVPTYVYETRTTVTVEESEAKAAAGEKGPVEAPAAEPADGVAVADPKPAAGSPATERMLREASEMFRRKEYYDAAVQFRLAAIAEPDLPAPLFALGQSLLAMGQDAYAARVLRKAVLANPTLLDETADLAGVYESQAEFDRVMGELERRAADAPADGDARFLLGYQRFFGGDPRAREVFDGLHAAAPKDGAVDLFRAAVEKRFRAAADLPPIEKP